MSVEPPDPAFLDDWDVEDQPTAEEIARAAWRRRVILVVATITVLAMGLLPLYNLLDRGRPVADNGLEVCGFDYCVVQDQVNAAGLGVEMSRLSNIYLSDGDAYALAEALVRRLGEEPVDFVVVDRLDWRIKGQYEPDTRTIRVERPVTAWIVLHEVAHVPSHGHGAAFTQTLIELIALVP